MDLRRSIQRFPSPTGVKYYELRDITKSVERELFPSPTGVSIMNRNMKTFNESMINN